MSSMAMSSMTAMASTTTAASASATASSSSMNMSTSMSGMDSSCKVSMLWNWYTIDACFLSNSWHIKNNGMFAASCIGVALLVVCLEFLRRVGKEYDAFLLRQFKRNLAVDSTNWKDQISCELRRGGTKYVAFRATPLQQLAKAVIHAVTFGLAYIIMLLVMYYNGYIIISVIIGAGLGKFLCDWTVQMIPISGPKEGEAPAETEGATYCCG